ncbi:3D domain-containing protein [Paenibacillus soyae]|uniref:3D domain-containing protein n=1 Tax=Paenibacillus soyae TaxID=2969249 RepID=A0A9X2MUN6_9BACL|nr:3D domain-containing protein [Paenibacillus soyae]MCR2806163.1 3D domain-containing protein [Paenibacillus soyae]
MRKSILASAAIAITVALAAGTGTAHAATKIHTVSASDTFWKLSRQYKVSLQSILDANKGVNPQNLRIGTRLTIPVRDEAAESKQEAVVTMKAASAESETMLVQGPGGYDYSFTKQINLQATAYSADPSENGGWGAVDYFGNKLKIGTVAVDPNVIPLGTKLYITGYDYIGLPKIGIIATASDTGGAIKGNRVDIFVPGSRQQALSFGIQNVKAYILK